MITTEKAYKPSSFAYILEDGQDIIFYNSMEGISSIKKMPINCKNKIDRYFSMQTIPYETDSVLDALVQNHYIIPYEWNEKKLINNLYAECMNSSILHLVILPTEQCNFRCKYCYESFTRGRMSDETMDAIIKYVRTHIHQYTGLRVSWFGGEPALEIDHICKMSQAFLAICKHAKRTYWANITSNGYFINKENFEKLYQSNVFDYQITIDGIKSTHDCQRVLAGGEGSFDRIIGNLMDIKNHKKYKRWNITIRTNFSKEIYDIFDEYIEFYYSHFHDDSRFSFLFRPAGDWGGTVVKDYAEHLLERDGLALIFEKMLESPKTLNIDRHLAFLNPGGSMCMAAQKNTFLIDSQGGIRKCSCHLDDNNNLIGKINEKGNFEFDYYRKNEWLFFSSGEEKCKNCSFLPSCLNNSCPANYVLKRGSTEECYVYEKKYLDYILRLVNKQGKIKEVCL